MQSYELCSDMIDVVLDLSSIYTPSSPTLKHTEDESYAIIKLNNGVLYMRPVNANLVIVCLIREDSFDKQGLIDYNFGCLCASLREVLDG